MSRLPLAQRLATECKTALAEAVDQNTSGGEWLVTDDAGDQYYTSLIIDEGRGCLVISLCDCDTGEVKHQFRVSLVCEQI